MKHLMLLLCLSFSFLTFPLSEVVQAGDEPYIGEISLFAGNFAPRGWAFCEGQMLAIRSNTALFSILGTTYGGDGRTTFQLPDLRKAEAKLKEASGLQKQTRGLRYIIALKGIYPSRN